MHVKYMNSHAKGDSMTLVFVTHDLTYPTGLAQRLLQHADEGRVSTSGLRGADGDHEAREHHRRRQQDLVRAGQRDHHLDHW